MKNVNHGVEIVGLGILTGIMLVLIASAQSTPGVSAVPAAASDPAGICSISFNGNLTSLQMSPEGSWAVTSSYCSVTAQSSGITSGTFTGSFSSSVASGVVTGTWSIAGSTQKVVASSPGFTLSISGDMGMSKVPLLGSAFQGVLATTGTQQMLAVGTAGQITVK